MAAGSDFIFPKNDTKILINFGEICRFCLTYTQSDISVNDACFPKGSPEEVELDTIYSFVTNLKITKMSNAETFPSLVCKNCYEVIKICYNFFKVCQKSENILNGCYEKAIKEKSNILNGVLAKLPGRNLKIIHENKLEDISKSEESGREIKTSLISEREISENIESIHVMDPINSLTSESENYSCSLCSVKFSNQEALNIHHIYTHGKRCDEIFTDQEPLTDHDKQVSEQFREDIKEMKNLERVNVKAPSCFHCSPSKNFQTKEDLNEHMKTHEKKHSYKCPCCDDKFFLKLSLHQHLISSHNLRTDAVSQEDVKLLKQELIRSEGDDVIHSVTDFLNFYRDKNKNFSVFCKTCHPAVNFTTTNDFITHMVSLHSNVYCVQDLAVGRKTAMGNNSGWKCSDCPAKYSQKHNKQKRECKKCPICSETFLTNRKVIQHGITAHQKYFANFHKVFNKIIHPSHETVTPTKNFECDLCQKRYIFKTSLKKHIFSVHLREPKDSVACPYCGKMLANKLNLKSHIEFKHEALFVSCPICKKKINFRTIGRHYKVHRNGSEVDGQNSFLCTQCGKILKSKRSFEDHQKIHKNIRSELCDVCGGGYATKKALRLHKKTHEGAQRKLHECDRCDKVFSGRHTLNRHLLTHSGVKNFICEICSKCFYTLQELNRHVRYHKKEYRFECQQCDMRFVDKSRFRHHLMKHKNIRPYKCQFCEKMFIVRGKMNLHMASKHNVQVDAARVWKDPNAYIPLDELL